MRYMMIMRTTEAAEEASKDVSFDEMDELALHFAAYYGWPKASRLNQAIGDQRQRVLDESAIGT